MTAMKQVRGIWLPEHETDIVRFLEKGLTFAGLGTYQLRKLLAAFPYVKDFKHAVDVGAHVGTWSCVLARCFTRITAFEPIDALADCFERNLDHYDLHCEVKLHRVALSNKNGKLRMDQGSKATMLSHVDNKDGKLRVECRTLDSFELDPFQFLKIDVEGFEKMVLLGGEETIRKHKPLVIIEQKQGQAERYGLKQYSARGVLKGWGAAEKWELDGDVCMTWK
jgi:FkbM family methyltransferase